MARLRWITILTVFLASTAALAQDPGYNPQLDDRFRVYLGGFWPSVDSDISINGTDVAPPPVDFEDVFGLDKGNGVLWGGARWRISRRNLLEFEFFELSRDGRRGFMNEAIGIGDYIVESGEIDTSEKMALGRLTYGFSVIRNQRVDFQVLAGFHILKQSANFQMTGNVCDAAAGQMPPGCPAVQSPAVDAADITAPLPHLGAAVSYAITPTVATRFQVIGFAVDINDIDGSILEVDADISWNPWRHFGAGAGIRYFRTSVKASKSDFSGEFNYDYLGPVLYVQSTF